MKRLFENDMTTLLTLATLGNLIDTAATLYLSSLGYIEANPVMAWLLRWPAAFVGVKIGAMTAVVWWLWRRRGDRNAALAATVAAMVYGAVSVYYIVFFTAWL